MFDDEKVRHVFYEIYVDTRLAEHISVAEIHDFGVSVDASLSLLYSVGP